MHHGDALENKRGRGAAVPSRLRLGRWPVKRAAPSRLRDGTFASRARWICDPPVKQLRILPVRAAGTPLSDSTTEQPPFVGRAEVGELLSPTFTEFLLFLATLILFVASWQTCATR
jgi:hypothetical protein